MITAVPPFATLTPPASIAFGLIEREGEPAAHALGGAIGALLDALDDPAKSLPIYRAVHGLVADMSEDHRSTITLLLYELAEAITPTPNI